MALRVPQFLLVATVLWLLVFAGVALWTVRQTGHDTRAPSAFIVPEPDACYLPAPDPWPSRAELDQLRHRLDSLRCAVHSVAERHGHPKWMRTPDGGKTVATRSIPGAFDWAGWGEWDRCAVCGSGWPCNRQVVP